jgi:hypothetical protein
MLSPVKRPSSQHESFIAGASFTPNVLRRVASFAERPSTPSVNLHTERPSSPSVLPHRASIFAERPSRRASFFAECPSGVLLAKRRPSLFTLSLIHLGHYFSPGFFHPAKHASCRQASFVSTIVFCYT